MCMKLTRCHEDVTDMGSPLPQSDNCSPLTPRAPQGVGASNSRLFLWPSPLCCWQMYGPWSLLHNAMTMQLIQTASLLEKNLLTMSQRAHIIIFIFGECNESPSKLYFDRAELVTCLLSNTICLSMHYNALRLSWNFSGVALCGRYCIVWCITYWWSG